MSLFARFAKKSPPKDGTLVAVFDIASASVGGLLFRHRKNAIPEILISVRRPADMPPEKGFQQIWRSLHKALEEVSGYLKKATGENPETAICVFSSPWYISQTKIIKIKRDNVFTFEKNLIEKLIDDEVAIFTNKWQKSALGEKGKASPLEHMLVKSMINGYDIENPLGLSSKNLELYVYLSLCLSSMKEKIKNDILTYIKPHQIFFHSFPFILYSILKKLVNTHEGLVLLDITGELTDVFLIRGGVIEEANCFPRGENFLVRRVASAFNLGFVEAKTLVSQYQRKELEPAKNEKIDKIFQAAGLDWAESLKKLFTEMSKDRPLPQNLYFCGCEGSISENIAPILKKDFAPFTVMGTPFDVKYLMSEAFVHQFNFDKGFSNSKNIFLLLSALFADKMLRRK